MEKKPFQLQLKIVWFKNCLGLAIDHIVLGQNYSLTPYYFWPKTEAWEQLKLELDSKLWLSQEEKIRILKITGDVMNYWASFRHIKTTKDSFIEDFPEVAILTLNN